MSLLGPLCAFAASVTWAIGSSNYSRMNRTHSAFQVNLSRAIFALPLFIVATFLTSGGWEGGLASFSEANLSHLGWFSLSILCSYAIGDVLFFWSTMSLGVPGSLAIASSYPLLMALFGFFILGEPMKAVQWMGLLIAIGGIVTVILTDPIKPSKPLPAEGTSTAVQLHWRENKTLGVLLAAATAICWATNTYAVGRGGSNLDAAVTSSIRMALALVFSSLSCIAIDRKLPSLVNRDTWKKYGWVFFVEAFLGTYAFAYGLAHSSLVLGAVLTSLAPVIAVPVAVALRLEKFSLRRTLAVAAVVLGLALV